MRRILACLKNIRITELTIAGDRPKPKMVASWRAVEPVRSELCFIAIPVAALTRNFESSSNSSSRLRWRLEFAESKATLGRTSANSVEPISSPPKAGAPPAWFHCLRSVACRRSNQNRRVRVELKPATFSV